MTRGLQSTASMRPRVFPAEDVIVVGHARYLAAASMRPRVFPAEDMSRETRSAVAGSASMRPRVFPAEDVPRSNWYARRTGCFNEAAGIPRGRR